LRLLRNPNALVAVSKGMRAVKLCTNKILQVLNWRCWLTQVDLHNGRKMVVAVVVRNVMYRYYSDSDIECGTKSRPPRTFKTHY